MDRKEKAEFEGRQILLEYRQLSFRPEVKNTANDEDQLTDHIDRARRL